MFMVTLLKLSSQLFFIANSKNVDIFYDRQSQ